MNCTNCDPLGGWCEVHQLDKSAYRVKLCQTKPNYRRAWDEGRGPGQVEGQKRKPKPPRQGPGTELHKLLAKLGIRETPSCGCRSRERQMNAWGPDGCLERLDEVVDWMASEAKQRGLPFVRTAGVVLVRWAVRRARRQSCCSAGCQRSS